jgi:tetratricopeptide (TPR) repeat protein
MEKAFESFRECVRLDPKNPAVLCEIGRRYSEQGNFEKALASADDAIRLFPENADAIALRAFCLAMLKQKDRAFKEFDRAIRINPRCGIAYYSRGIMMTNDGDYQKALPDLNKGIELGQRTWQIYLARATVYHHRREQEKEIADLEEAHRLDPENALAQRGLAWNLATGPKKLRDGKRALDLANRLCTSTDYRDANALEVLAAAHAEAGDFREAVRWQQAAIQIYAESDSNHDRYYVGFPPVELARMRLGSYEKNTPLRE